MFKHYAVRGKLPDGRVVRGVVATSGDIVMRGPDVLCQSPWNKRPLTLGELTGLVSVRPCPRPSLTTTIQQRIEHAFVNSPDPLKVLASGRFLEMVQQVRERLP